METNQLICGLLTTLCLCGPGMANAGSIIANSSANITAADISDIFLGEKQFIGGGKVVPVDNASLQAAFVKAILNVELPKYQTQWIKKSFRDGINPPPVKGSDAEVAAFVKSTPGAVGYVEKVPDGVKVIKTF